MSRYQKRQIEVLVGRLEQAAALNSRLDANTRLEALRLALTAPQTKVRPVTEIAEEFAMFIESGIVEP